MAGANLLSTFIPGPEHILAGKLKSLGSHCLLLIATVDQWERLTYPSPCWGTGHQHRAGGREDLAAEGCVCACVLDFRL